MPQTSSMAPVRGATTETRLPFSLSRQARQPWHRASPRPRGSGVGSGFAQSPLSSRQWARGTYPAEQPLEIGRPVAYVSGICWRWLMPEQRHVRLFRNGRNQAVRIPVEFELPGDEAIMHRDGDRLVIEPVRKRGLIALLKTMKPLEEDFPEIDDPVPSPESVL